MTALPVLSEAARADIQRKISISLEFERRECERSLSAFAKSAWHIIEPGTPLLWNWHLDTICGYLEAFHYGTINRRLIINIPPGTLKSILVSVMYPAWVWISSPDKRFLTITNEQGLAIRDALRMKQVVTSNWFQEKWPLALQADQNEKGLFANNSRGFRQSQGITASNTGKRGDCVVGSTLVSTEIGDIRIDKLSKMKNKPLVWSFNHESEKLELKRIIAVKQSITVKTIKVSTLSSVIICTPEHRIYTECGYERAENICGRNVSVLRRTNNAASWKTDQVRKVRGYFFDLHNLRKGFQKGRSGIRQAFTTRVENRSILLKAMRKTNSQSSADACYLSVLQKSFQGKKYKKKVLLKSMSKLSAFPNKIIARQTLRALWSNNGNPQRKEKVLHNDLQKLSPFESHERPGKFSFSFNNGAGRSIYQDAAFDKRAGRALLRNMLKNEKVKGFISASHRLARRKQLDRKLDNAVRLLPHEDSQIVRSERVISVAEFDSHSDEQQRVYDIQVDGNNNFFANGILVHNCLIIDDPIDAKHAFSDVIRTSVNDTWDQSLSSRLNDPVESGVLLIMQRLHSADLAGHLQKKVKTKWTVLSIPMRYEDAPAFDAGEAIGRPELNDPRTKKGELLFASRFTKSAVEALEEDLGEYGTAGQLQQRPVPSGGGIIKSHWWRLWPDDKPKPICEHVFLSYDTAFSERDMKTSAFSAMTRWGIFWHEQRQRYCLMCLGRWFDRVGYDELRKQAKTWESDYQPDAHLIEKKATGISLIQDLRKALPSKVRSYTPGKGDDKISRAHSVSPMFEAGLIYIADKAWAQNKESTGLIDYVASFPNGGPPSADLTDTVTQACIYLRSGNWVSHPDDDEPGEDQRAIDEDEEPEVKPSAY